jgi:hypothetical protein
VYKSEAQPRVESKERREERKKGGSGNKAKEKRGGERKIREECLA